MSGRIQCYLTRDDLGAEAYDEVTSLWDIGDIVGVSGRLMRTNRGELTVRASEAVLLNKTLRALPEKFHGLTDQETRYRHRYVDLIVNEDSRRVFEVRSRVVRAIRNFFEERGFLEVETPMMHPIPGGALARPFVTHHNSLDMDLYLRVAPELFPEAARGGRLRAGLRDQPQLPQRGPVHPAQPRVHHARVLLGL